MKILHACLANYYVDGFAYQENELVRAQVGMGHEVMVIASTETVGTDGRMGYLDPGLSLGSEGAPVLRLPYRSWLPHRIMRKVRAYRGFYEAIEAFGPDVIMFHGAAAWDVREAARYVRAHPKVKLFLDLHADATNGSQSLIAKEILHRRFYGPVLRSVLPFTEKLLCVAVSAREYARDMYRIPDDKLEIYPLGGRYFDDDEYASRRDATRARLGLDDYDVMLLQAGKQNGAKKLVESLEAFAAAPDARLRFCIAGELADDIRQRAETLIEADPRVHFLGWQSAEALLDLLCAADVYLQPGTQSATMQLSMCCRCAVILPAHRSHDFYRCDNGWYLSHDGDLVSAMRALPSADLRAMQSRSGEFARTRLDYRLLADRIVTGATNGC